MRPHPVRGTPGIVFLFLLPISVLATACSGAAGERTRVVVPLLTDVLTLEASIEDDPTLGDYQIVDPSDIGVDAAGNIYLADEHALKVYRPDGTPLNKIGREGSGPGEFVASFSAHIGPRGHIAAMDILWDANIYAPDGEFLYRCRYRNQEPYRDYLQERGFTFTMMHSIVALDADRLLIDLFGMDNTQPGPYTTTSQLICADADTLIELCRYVDYGSIKVDENSNNSVDFQGELLWSLLDADRLVYSETHTDRRVSDSGSEYRLIVLDLNTLTTDTLHIPWEPVDTPPEVRNPQPTVIESIGLRIEVDPAVREIMQETAFYPPLKALRADRGTIFGFHFSPTDSAGRDWEDEDLEVEPHLVDVIDLATGELRARAEFPFLPEVIRDGMAYRLYTPNDDFPAVYTYRISDAIYPDSGAGRGAGGAASGSGSGSGS